MAYDPEARRQSNSALIFGLIALLVVGGAALAYFASRTNEPTSTVITTVDPAPRTDTVVIDREVPVPVQVPAQPSTIVVQEPPTSTSTTIERNTQTTREVLVPSTSTTTTTMSSSTASGETAPADGTVSNDAPANGAAGAAGANAPATTTTTTTTGPAY